MNGVAITVADFGGLVYCFGVLGDLANLCNHVDKGCGQTRRNRLGNALALTLGQHLSQCTQWAGMVVITLTVECLNIAASLLSDVVSIGDTASQRGATRCTERGIQGS
jgi:hypothetical protein